MPKCIFACERLRTTAERSEVGWSGLLGIFNVPPNPRRLAAAIHHSANHHGLRVVGVVNGEGKSVRKRPVKTAIRLRVNSKQYLQGLHVGVKARQKEAPPIQALAFRSSKIRRSGRRAPNQGFAASSRSSLDLSFSFVPIEDRCSPLFESEIALIQDIFVPLRHFDLTGLCSDLGPDRLKQSHLFRKRHPPYFRLNEHGFSILHFGAGATLFSLEPIFPGGPLDGAAPPAKMRR